MCVDMCIDMCMNMCIDMCIDMCIHGCWCQLISLPRACSASDAQQHVTDLALLIQLALLRPLQSDQEVCSLVCHRTMLVQHHTEALQTLTPVSQFCFLYKN